MIVNMHHHTAAGYPVLRAPPGSLMPVLIQSLNCWIDTLATAQRARVFRHFFDFAHRRPRYAIFRILRDERFKHCATIP